MRAIHRLRYTIRAVFILNLHRISKKNQM